MIEPSLQPSWDTFNLETFNHRFTPVPVVGGNIVWRREGDRLHEDRNLGSDRATGISPLLMA